MIFQKYPECSGGITTHVCDDLDMGDMEIIVLDGRWVIFDAEYESYKINCCPICGERLEGKEIELPQSRLDKI